LNKGIAFDLDGVLLDYSYRFHKTYEDTLSNFDLSCPSREELFNLRRENNISSRDFLEKFLIPREVNERKALIEKIVSERNKIIESDEYLEYDQFFDGIIDLIHKIKDKGIKIGIITSRKKKEPVLTQLQELAHLFDFIEAVEDKENALRVFIKKFELSECFFLSDTSYDILQGNKAQVKSIGVLTGMDGEDILKLSKPFMIFNNVQEILKLI